jgi:hypothetical protein
MAGIKKLVGFAGPAGCGKSTAAMSYISARQATKAGERGIVLSYATPLKRCLRDLFQFKPSQLATMEAKQTVDSRYGVTPRHLMQQFGTEFVRKVVPDLWLILMDQTLTSYRASPSSWVVCVDDVRFSDEADLIREAGGSIVHLTGRGGIDGDHESEREIPRLDKDIVADNSGSLGQLLDTLCTTL